MNFKTICYISVQTSTGNQFRYIMLLGIDTYTSNVIVQNSTPRDLKLILIKILFVELGRLKIAKKSHFSINSRHVNIAKF